MADFVPMNETFRNASSGNKVSCEPNLPITKNKLLKTADVAERLEKEAGYTEEELILLQARLITMKRKPAASLAADIESDINNMMRIAKENIKNRRSNDQDMKDGKERLRFLANQM